VGDPDPLIVGAAADVLEEHADTPVAPPLPRYARLDAPMPSSAAL
jgi:hypothetical protein